MDHALEVGVNFFDTANVYGWKKGEGVTEQIVGRWWAQGGGRRDKVVIATKVYGDMGEWPNTSRLSKLHMRQALDASLRRLKTDYIDLYQFHHVWRETSGMRYGSFARARFSKGKCCISALPTSRVGISRRRTRQQSGAISSDLSANRASITC